MEKYDTARQATDDNLIRRMRFASWIHKATDTHVEYVTVIPFALQQWLYEQATLLHLYLHFLSLFLNSHSSTCPRHEGLWLHSVLKWTLDGGEQSLYSRGITRYKQNGGGGCRLSRRTGSETSIALPRSEPRTTQSAAQSLYRLPRLPSHHKTSTTIMSRSAYEIT